MMTTTRSHSLLRSRLLPLAAAATAGALLLAGCGGTDGQSAAVSASSTPTGAANGTTASASPTGSASPSAESVAATTDPSAAATTDPSAVASDDSQLDGTVPNDLTAANSEVAPESVFGVLSPWNQEVTTSGISPTSATQLDRANVRVNYNDQGQPIFSAQPAGLYINTRDWTDAVVAGGVPTVLTCRQQQCGEGNDDITVDVPTDVSPDPLYDGWFTIFDPANDIAYDLWRARREADGSISFNFLREWQIDGTGYLRPYEVSARGSGLPLFGGLIRTGELERGEIDHALAISLPAPAKTFFVQPASSTDGNGLDTSVPEGARLRLRSNFQLTKPRDTLTGKLLPFNRTQRRYALTIIRTLQTYGAIVVDRAAVPTLYYERTTNNDDGNDTGAGGNTLGSAPVTSLDDNGMVVGDDGSLSGDVSGITGTTARPDLNALQGYILQNLKLRDFEVVDYSDQMTYQYPRKSTNVDASGLAGVGAVSGSGSDTTTEEGQ